MQLGDILYFTTEKVRGRYQRPKYQVYLFEGDWRDDGEYGFLFINKSNSFGNGFEIRKADGYQIELDHSYIICASPVSYTEVELDTSDIEARGRLRNEDIVPLMEYVQESQVLEGHHINKICAALRSMQA
jgi:hypothetical protein